MPWWLLALAGVVSLMGLALAWTMIANGLESTKDHDSIAPGVTLVGITSAALVLTMLWARASWLSSKRALLAMRRKQFRQVAKIVDESIRRNYLLSSKGRQDASLPQRRSAAQSSEPKQLLEMSHEISPLPAFLSVAASTHFGSLPESEASGHDGQLARALAHSHVKIGTSEVGSRVGYYKLWALEMSAEEGVLVYAFRPDPKQPEVCPFTVSLWQYGDVCHVGVFVQGKSLLDDPYHIHPEKYRKLLGDLRSLCLVGSEHRQESARHVSDLIDCIFRCDNLLSNSATWDLIARQASQFASHGSIALFNAIADSGKSAEAEVEVFPRQGALGTSSDGSSMQGVMDRA